MEFNQDNRSFCTAVTVLDTVAEQLCDVDLTLPDYCPDIEKILKCTLTPKIQTKTLSGGQLQVDGFCIVSVLYVESLKKTIRCCEQSVNFSQSFSVKETPDNPVIITKTKSEYINCRALSPRRLVMHGAFSLYAKVLSSSQTKIYIPDSSDNLETNKLSLKCASLCCLCQEQFSVCEEISVGEKPAVESILCSDVGINITEAKAVTGKLLINGEINLKLLYLCDVETGDTEKIDFLLPFNQVMDCEGIDENTLNCVSCDIMSYDIRLKNDAMSEKPSILLDLKLSLTEQGYLINEEEVVTDAYSVKYACQPEFEQMTIVNDVARFNESHIEKSTVKIDDGKISKIINIYAEHISAQGSCEGDCIRLEGKINLCILACNNENMPVFIERSVDYSHELSSGDCNCVNSSQARVASISYRLSDDNAIEVRCELKLIVNAAKKSCVKAVSAVNVFEDKPIAADDCALTLYFAKQGESLWNIAKAHNTRLDMLIEENSAEKQVLECPQMLLIPRV